MYKHLGKLLSEAKKKLRVEFNRLGVMGFDALNVINTRKITEEMFERLLATNEALYLDAAKTAYRKGVKSAKGVGFSGEETNIDSSWLKTILVGYNLVTGYLYSREAERKRLRLNEQILTAREYGDRQLFQDSLRRTVNLWWTQTAQYGLDVVDRATLQAFEDMGVEYVRWIAKIDKRTCKVCRKRDNVVYAIKKVPPKTHYNCRCYLEPVRTKE